MSMLSSCASFGIFSAYLGRYQDDGAAHAAIIGPVSMPSATYTHTQPQHTRLRASVHSAAQRGASGCSSTHAVLSASLPHHNSGAGGVPSNSGRFGGVLEAVRGVVHTLWLPFGRASCCGSNCHASALLQPHSQPVSQLLSTRHGQARLPKRQVRARRIPTPTRRNDDRTLRV